MFQERVINMHKIKRKIVYFLLFLFLFALPQNLSAMEQDPVIEKSILYLKSMQNEDGGFTNRQGTPSSDRLTHWVLMALKAAGEDVNSNKWRENGNSPLDFVLKNTQLDETTHYARALMALRAAGYRGLINGINLEEEIISFQKANGHFAQYDKGEQDLINAHIWSIFALTAAGRDIPQKDKAKAWLLAQQNIDGGFGWAVGGDSDPDSTGVAITALVILGETPGSSPIKRAIKYLNNQQEAHGGFSSSLNKANSASNAWAIQGLLAAGENTREGQWNKQGNNPYNYLKSLQNPQGYFEWMENRQASPVLMTAYAIMALAEKPFPVNIDYQPALKKVVLIIGQKEAWIGNTKTSLEVAPKIIQNSTMVPLRFIAESLGAIIDWDDTTQKVQIKLGNKSTTLTPSIIEEGRTLVPVRYISESLGAKVTWYEKAKRIEIEI